MYSAIKKARSQEGDWIVIQGAGGGLGHMFAYPGSNHHKVQKANNKIAAFK